MEKLYRSIKYVGVIFFAILLMAGAFQYYTLFQENTYASAVYSEGSVTILDENKKAVGNAIPAKFELTHYEGQIVEVLHNEEGALILEWNQILRNNLILLLFIGVLVILIINDRKEDKKRKQAN
jgi:hypothetical protein